MGNGQWAMGNGQWAMGNGQWDKSLKILHLFYFLIYGEEEAINFITV
jgi:hypothetical protein